MMIPLSLYIHFPWCIKKCPYCDFNSFHKDAHFDEAAYLQRLLEDFKRDYETYGFGRKFQSIFMGGGTPSLFSAKTLETLLEALRPYCLDPIEITLEANPGTIEHGQFQDYFKIGINRISLGAQSFNPKHLKILGRIHGQDDIHRAVDEIKTAGFKNFNIDVMHGLPQQTLEEAMKDLQLALALQSTHLSWYQLTIEPNTYFARFPPQLPQDHVLADIEAQGFELLQSHGFQRYEISAFAQPGYECRHNLNYWTFGDYLGIGAGAHGKITDLSQRKIYRSSKPKLPKTYLSTSFLTEIKEVLPEEQILEFMLNALRLTQGFESTLLRERIFATDDLPSKLQKAQDQGLLEVTENWIRPTAQGLRFLNDLIMIFH